MLTSCRKSIMQGLTDGEASAMLKAPKDTRGVAIAFSQSPTVGEVLPAHTAIFRAPAGTVSSGQRVYIGRVATSDIREDSAVSSVTGERCSPCLFLLIPKKH